MSSTSYISVLTTAPQQVPAYLYGHSTAILTLTGDPGVSGGRTGIILAVRSERQSAALLAETQADRLSSGLHAATQHDTFLSALDALTDRLVASRHTSTTYRVTGVREVDTTHGTFHALAAL
jgi:hypothetical protein